MSSGFSPGVGCEEIRVHLRGHRLQLIDRRGTIDVTRYDEHLLLLFAQILRELAGRRGLAGALQTGHQDHRRRQDGKIERDVGLAHEAREFAMHHPDQGLPGRKAADHLLAHRLVLHRRDEVLHDRQRDVGLEQRHAHLAQRLLHVGFGQARLAAYRLYDARKAVRQVIEHRWPWGVRGAAETCAVVDSRDAGHCTSPRRERLLRRAGAALLAHALAAPACGCGRRRHDRTRTVGTAAAHRCCTAGCCIRT